MKYGKVVEGNLEITKDCKDDFSEVVEVKGYISLWQGATRKARCNTSSRQKCN